jgi:hypothetical protein
MHVDLALGNGIEQAQISKKKIQLYILLIVTRADGNPNTCLLEMVAALAIAGRLIHYGYLVK